jgi:hypothetical protein
VSIILGAARGALLLIVTEICSVGKEINFFPLLTLDEIKTMKSKRTDGSILLFQHRILMSKLVWMEVGDFTVLCGK